MRKTVDIELFKKAIQPLQNLLDRELNNYELKSIYYTLFDSPTDKDFHFIIEKYAKYFYFYNGVTALEISLIIDIFKHYGLTHIDLERAFKIRTQKVLAKARVWPTPAELIVLVKPDAVVNIYNDVSRQSVTDNRTTQEIQESENQHIFKKYFGTLNA